MPADLRDVILTAFRSGVMMGMQLFEGPQDAAGAMAMVKRANLLAERFECPIRFEADAWDKPAPPAGESN